MKTWIEFFEPVIEIVVDELLGLKNDPDLISVQTTLAVTRIQMEMNVLNIIPFEPNRRADVVAMEMVGECRKLFASPYPGVEEVLFVLDKVLMIRASKDLIDYKSTHTLSGIKNRTALGRSPSS